jgi:kynurenine formamidase
MQAYQLEHSKFFSTSYFLGQSILPNNSILLERTPFNNGVWPEFFSACVELKNQISTPDWVFVNAAWDPVKISNQELQIQRQELQAIFPQSKVCILSAHAQHFYDDIPGCVYFPQFLTINYHTLNFKPRSGRIGCLNRRNAAHRIWLMHNLLEQNLIDNARDVYSVSFTCLHTGTYIDVDNHMQTNGINQAQQQWPRQIATHPDNFPNDYSIDHPAWHTGITIITETEPGEHTIICEKTGKGILSKSCFSIYMSEIGYQVLEDLGFEPIFLPKHAK